MRSAKRVILANDSRLLREMLHHVIDKTNHLEVIREVANYDELSSTIEQFDPEWVIASLPVRYHADHWIISCMENNPSVRFIFLSPNHNYIKIRWQRSNEEDYLDVSLKELIQILETDLQRT